MKKNGTLTKEEHKQLTGIIDKLVIERSLPYKNRSGGFVTIESYGHNREIIYLIVKHGIQDGIEDTVHTEFHQVNRKTMKLKL